MKSAWPTSPPFQISSILKKPPAGRSSKLPRTSRNKFDYDPESNLFLLAGLLPEGMMFPFDFGFIPSTLGDDGDPLDIMVLMDAPAHVGCLIDVRIIGIIDAEQTQDGKTEKNSRILGAAIHSYEHENLFAISDVSKTLLSQVEEFFISYNKQRGKKFKITDTGGPKKASALSEEWDQGAPEQQEMIV